MGERARCWDCGKFVPIGKGITAEIIRIDDRQIYYCDKCLKKGAILRDGSVGDMMSFLRERNWVKEFRIV